MNFEKLLHEFSLFIRNEAKTETVVGSPFTLGEYTCVPVIKIGVGFGGGGGGGGNDKVGKGEGIAGGVGFGVEPIGFLVSRGDKIDLIHIGKSGPLDAVFDKAPGLIEKFFEARAKKDKE